MSVIFIILPIAIVMAGLALVAFVLSVRRGQFDDVDTPPLRAILDDDPTVAADRASSRLAKHRNP
jgi:cbb3-type cytochrome oxidase maturation protein